MQIPKKYLHNSGNLNQKALQIEGNFKKNDVHPRCSSIVFKQYTKRTGEIKQVWETLEVSITNLKKRKFCNMTSEKQNHIRDGRKRWVLENIDKVKEYKRKESRKHRKKNSNRAIAWNKENNKRRKEITKRYRERHKSNPQYAVKNKLRDHMRRIRPGFKSESTADILDCTIEHCCNHLESQFTEGMTWDNMGKSGWHIDHIIPCAFFDLTKPNHQKVCFNWQNLQPLWESDNCAKGDKIPWYVLLTILMNNCKTITL